MSSVSSPWQHLYYSSILKFSKDAYNSIINDFRNHPGAPSAQCTYDEEDHIFEITCLCQYGQRALSTLRQIISTYELLEERIKPFEDARVGELDDVLDDGEELLDRIDTIALPGSDESFSTEPWFPTVSGTDLHDVLPTYILSEIGRLTISTLIIHDDGCGVNITFGPDGDLQGARRKLSKLEWFYNRESPVAQLLKMQRAYRFDLRFEQLKSARDGTLGRLLTLPESRLQGRGARDLARRSICRYHKFDRIAQKFFLQRPVVKQLDRPFARGSADAFNAVYFRDLGDASPGDFKIATNTKPSSVDAQKVVQWMDTLEDDPNLDELVLPQTKSAPGSDECPKADVTETRALSQQTGPATETLQNGTSRSGSGSTSNHFPAKHHTFHSETGPPQLLDLIELGDTKSANESIQGPGPISRQPVSLSLPTRTHSADASELRPRTLRETPIETQLWAQASTSHNWGGFQGNIIPGNTAVPSRQSHSQLVQNAGANQPKMGTLIDFSAPSEPKRLDTRRQHQQRQCQDSKPPVSRKTSYVKPKQSRPQKNNKFDSRNIFASLQDQDHDQNLPSSPSSSKAETQTAPMDDPMDDWEQRNYPVAVIAPNLHAANESNLHLRETAIGDSQVEGFHQPNSQALHKEKLQERLQPAQSDEKRVFRRTMRQRTPAPGGRGRGRSSSRRGRGNSSSQSKALHTLRSLQEEAALPIHPSKKIPGIAKVEDVQSQAKASRQKTKKNLPCQAFRAGRCGKTIDECPYAHDLGPLLPCKKFAEGKCHRGPDCRFPHMQNNVDIRFQRSPHSIPAAQPKPQSLVAPQPQSGLASISPLADPMHSKLELWPAASAAKMPDDSLATKQSSSFSRSHSDCRSHETMAQYSSPHETSEADAADEQAQKEDVRKSFVEGTKKALDHARSFRGHIDIRLQVGKVIFLDVSEDLKQDLTPPGFSAIISRVAGFDEIDSCFSNLLTTTTDDVDWVLQFAGVTDPRNPFKVESAFELICEGLDKAELHLVVDASTANEPYVAAPDDFIGAVYVHAPQRVWDARLLVSATRQTPTKLDTVDGAKGLVDSLYVRKKANELIPYVEARDGLGLDVKTVRLHTRMSYSLGETSPVAVEIKRVHDFKLRRRKDEDHGNGRLLLAESVSSEEMIREQRLWYEVALVLTKRPTAFEENVSLETGEETRWQVDDVVDEWTIRSIEEVGTGLVERMDNVGLGNRGVAWEYETRKMEKQRSTSEAPDEFW